MSFCTDIFQFGIATIDVEIALVCSSAKNVISTRVHSMELRYQDLVALPLANDRTGAKASGKWLSSTS